ncbi:metallo-beta-lactamase domain-containing protein 1 isoform X2 [Ceratina calcarata]|uniref:Metallo-beta-lactamase domain-containing protein 1 n=1 Tax=Ceratina calcarata TaxID=156304 RepID=A0AAJ7J1Z3_9HYME|nr:metallo-beta-lactamase domain-containing protein 1 isoform X2 [Ceratina calcarata]
MDKNAKAVDESSFQTKVKMCQVIVLFSGYSTKLDETLKANCSCTLIKASRNIIVDTMTAWDRQRIIDALAEHDITADQIDYVVCTHSHADHIGNNNLFLNAEHIIGTCVHRGDEFFERNFENEGYRICPGVRVVATPGHTSDDVTVLVDTTISSKSICFAITGDLFEKEDDILDPSIWKEFGTAELQATQSRMRSDIMHLANFIVPGHGPMFAVTEDLRKIIKSQIIV